MRILFVAMSSSVHAARWIAQLADLGWDLHLFPSRDYQLHSQLRDVTVHGLRARHVNDEPLHRSVRVKGPWWPSRGHRGIDLASKYLPRWFDAERRLARLIRTLRPDIVHSLEMQHAGYLTLAANRLLGGRFPPWMVNCWGNDLYLYARVPDHIAPIKAVLAACDYFGADCQRDIDHAQQLGFTGTILPVLPASGGLQLERVGELRSGGAPSTRRLVMLKGYQGLRGRALVALRAIEKCADVLSGYRIVVYSAGEEVALAAQLLNRETPIEIASNASHEEILSLHGRARISIGLSISDGAPVSLFEAMAMGSFPIQSETACFDEWIEPGVSGLIVHPDDPEDVERAIRRALSDDALVDRAAIVNEETVAARLEYGSLKAQAVAIYERALAAASLE